MATGWKDQETWAITIHGTEMRIISAYFTKQYLQYVNGPFMYPSEKLVVFRTVPLNMKTKEGRVEGLEAAVTLLYYLKSNGVQMEILRLARADDDRKKPLRKLKLFARFFLLYLLLLSFFAWFYYMSH